MQRRRFSWHLAVRYFAVALAALALFAWLAVQAFQRNLSKSTWTEIEAAASLVATETAQPLEQQKTETVSEIVHRIGQNTRTRITLVWPDGKVLDDSRDDPQRMENLAQRSEIAEALTGKTGHDSRFSDAQKADIMYVAVPIRQGGKILGAARAGRSAAEIEQIYRDSVAAILMDLGIVAAAAGLLGWLLARSAGPLLEPLRKGAELLSQGQPMARLTQPEIEELASLAASLNTIARQLDERTQRLGRQGYQQEAVLASMVEGVLAVDAQESLIAVNSAASELVGGSEAELQGRNLHEVIRNADLRRFVQRALQSPDPIEDDIFLHGEPQRILRVRGTALRDGAGPDVGAVIVINDVTRYRHLENLRRDFVANVSHELKTPIASIKGFVETLLDGALAQPEDARRFLRIIASHADRLNNIIEDLLSLSKIEQSEEAANLPLVEAPLQPVLEAALHGCRTQAEARKIELVLNCDPEILAHINPPLFEQAVINLVDNAIKYSEPGGKIEVSAAQSTQKSETEQAPQLQGEITISVRDQGCGIAAEHLPRLFERFYRVDRARSRKLGGTGLGLAIVKHIIQAHQGTIEVTSTPGVGSVFSIHLSIPAVVAIPATDSPLTV